MTLHHTPPPPLRQSFVDAMSRVASSVSIVTTDGPEGRGGVTVTAMSSVSADGPAPQLLICLHSRGRTCAKVLRNGQFCVNLLREDQKDLADIFAGRSATDDAPRKAMSGWLPMGGGAPRLPDPLAAFSCRITRAECVGTHYVIFGAVQDVHVAKANAALIYANRQYMSAARVTG